MKSIFIAAIIAAACSSVALAGDAKQDQKAAAPAVKAQVMTDSEMDKVTAGSAHPNPGIGTETASGVANGHATVPFQGFGVCQTDASGRCNIPSDIRLKRDIVQVSRLDSGLGLYRYRYKWSDQVYVGVMAQEVALIRPDAVIRGADGYLRVDYSRLGLHLMTWDEWAASGGENGLKQTKAMSDSEMDKVTAGSAARAETFYLSENPYTVFNSGSKGYAINSNPNYNAVINGFNGKWNGVA